MRACRFAPMLVTAITLCVSLHPRAAGAQQVAAPSSPAAAASSPWDAHPAGRYRLTAATPNLEFEVTVTIADSSGTPVATMRPTGNDEVHPMTVTVKGTDLLLHLANPGGSMDFVLQHQGDRVTGTWTLDELKGTVTGTIEH